MMGGQVWVESQEGRGSIFHFTIRVPCLLDSPPEWLLTTHAHLAGRVAWIVAGSATIRSQLHDMLTYWGMTVHAMSTSTQVLAALDLFVEDESVPAAKRTLIVISGEFRRPDVILTSLLLQAGAKVEPRTSGQTASPTGVNTNENQFKVAHDDGINDGMKLAERVRDRFTKRELPIILMCALSERKQEAKLIVNGFATQPIKPGQLFKAIGAALVLVPSTHSVSSSTASSPNINIDTKVKSASRPFQHLSPPSKSATLPIKDNTDVKMMVTVASAAATAAATAAAVAAIHNSPVAGGVNASSPSISVIASAATEAAVRAASTLEAVNSPDVPVLRSIRPKVERVMPVPKRVLTILVVEDNLVNQKVIRQVLKMQVYISHVFQRHVISMILIYDVDHDK
jgi:CheY-like chemotaxis protein